MSLLMLLLINIDLKFHETFVKYCTYVKNNNSIRKQNIYESRFVVSKTNVQLRTVVNRTQTISDRLTYNILCDISYK